MKVGLTTSDWATVVMMGHFRPILRGVGWVRLGQYASVTKLNAVTGRLVWHPKQNIFGVREPDDTEHFDCDIIIDIRSMHKDIPGMIKKATQQGQVFVSDVDDWYWGGGPLTKNVNWIKLQPQTNPDVNINHYRQVIAASSAVFVSTPYLADRINWVNSKKKYLVENHIDFSQYPKREHIEQEKPTIGWTGFTGLRIGDLDILKAFYPSIVDDFGFHHSGHQLQVPKFADEVGLPEDRVSIVNAEPYIGYYREKSFVFDIGVAPLTNVAFNRAKSWLKGLEYTAAGIPFVASSVAEYVRLKNIYGVGRLAEKPIDWKRHLYELRSPELRAQEAAENLEKLRPLDLSVGVLKWESLLESLV